MQKVRISAKSTEQSGNLIASDRAINCRRMRQCLEHLFKYLAKKKCSVLHAGVSSCSGT
jgi:hypothetical protein